MKKFDVFSGGFNWYTDNYVIAFRTPAFPPLFSERKGINKPLFNVLGYRLRVQRRRPIN